eukprot:TRINITY_DN6491_c0_g1_i2.p1 TRINITY_DN6491_c0_g1~~TRINITY_DN6491_c0_g1_i2.p1  ORF type:complete len:179 (+),score=46.00 TRINITY_DN6491_c0_g1_i2:698-1234(+)
MVDIVDAGDRLTAKKDDQIALAKTGPGRWTVRIKRRHFNGGRFLQVESARQGTGQRTRLTGQTEVGPSHPAVGHQRCNDHASGNGGDGKTDPLGLGYNRGIHPNPHVLLSLIHISEPTRPLYISYAVFCLKKKKKQKHKYYTSSKSQNIHERIIFRDVNHDLTINSDSYNDDKRKYKS